MYHDIPQLLDKLAVISAKMEKLKQLNTYMTGQHSVQKNMKRLEEDRTFLVDDIRALCREVANDKGDTT